MEGSLYRKFSFSLRKGVVRGTGPRVLPSGNPGHLLAGSCLGSAVLPGASLRQDIAPVILLSRVPLRTEPHSEPGGGPVPRRTELLSTMRRGRSGGWSETLSEVPDASKDTQVDSSFGDESRTACVSVLTRGWPSKATSIFTDPFSSPIPSWGYVPEADSEVVPMVPGAVLVSLMMVPVPRSKREILLICRGNGGASEVAIYEAYREAGFRGVIPSLIGEVSSFFGFHLSHLEDFNSYPRFYHLRSRDGTPLVEKSSRGIRGNYPFGDSWNNRYVFVKIKEPVGYPTSWRTVVVAKLIMGVPRQFRWVTFLVSKEALRHSRVWGNIVRLSLSAIYDEHQKAKTRKRRPFYSPLPRLARAASLVNGLSSTSSTGAEAVFNQDPLVDAHQRLIGEVLFLRSQVQNMMARRVLLIQQVKASARWELMKEWLEKRVERWDPEEEYRRHLFLSGGIDQQSGSFSRVATPRFVVGS
ncbi:hypothetical protein F2Q69_00012934 [Brassica cretica]|uniref:Uncharacterized protein n=1 Tax=Brassica cretica TaxID=69181 RepID=A0A8S9R2X1_BRACR|nr:hypothetical protein F2Q69_00012934 [Brassica cretica]